jgi:hypothetical protein
MKNKTCKDCRYWYGDKIDGVCLLLFNKQSGDDEFCSWFEPPTVFDYLMQSEEMLAEKLVYEKAVKGRVPIYGEYGSTIGEQYVITNVWSSALTDDTYTNRAEALVATIEELKKEAKNE